MKVLDYALIFIVIVLPVVLVVNVNMSIKIKSQNMEVYYKNLIDSAISDASQEMKEVENSDNEVDYGYSGDGEKKVSINAEHAVNTFIKSLATNFNVKDNKNGEALLKSYIPAIAVIDYNGVHMYSAERLKDEDGNTIIDHVLKPKKYFTYSYKIAEKAGNLEPSEKFKIVPSSDPTGMGETRTVNFTLNNYITYIEAREFIDGSGNKLSDEDARAQYPTYVGVNKGETLRRFMQDPEMEIALFGAIADQASYSKEDYYNNLIEQLDEIRKNVIVDTVVNEVSYAISAHNNMARDLGIAYTFTFPTISEDDWFATVQDTGILAFVQGKAVGNKYLNHYSYGLSKLSYNQRYWATTGATSIDPFGYGDSVVGGKISYDKLYHKDKSCAIYKQCSPVTDPLNFQNRYDAAAGGYYPCPVCMYDTIDYYFDGGLNRNEQITTEKLQEALAAETEKEQINAGNTPQSTENLPYASYEKTVIGSSVKIELYAGDDETSVNQITLPNGDNVELNRTPRVLILRDYSGGNPSSNGPATTAIQSIPGISVNIVTEEQALPAENTIKNNYDVVMDISHYWSARNAGLLNNVFNLGVGVYTEGNDNTQSLLPITSSTRENYKWSVQKKVNNEVTKEIGSTIDLGTDSSNVITFAPETSVWYDMTDNGKYSPIVGQYNGSLGNTWIHAQIHNNVQIRNAYEKIIYRLAKTQYAYYVVNQNGRYEFILTDTEGNTRKVVVYVNEL